MFKSETSSRALRVGVLVHPDQVFEQWEVSLFERLDRNPAVSLAAFLVVPRPLRRRKPSIALRALNAFENAVFLRKGNSGVNLGSLGFGHIPCIPADEFDASGNLDVIISHLPQADASLPCALGAELWEYHFYTDGSGVHEAFGFHESLEAIPVTHSAILRRAADGSRNLVGSITTNTKFTAALNAHYAKDQLSALVERELLRRLRNLENEPAGFIQPKGTVPKPFPQVGLPQVLRYSAIVFGRTAERLAKLAVAPLGGQPDNWSLVVSEGDVLNSSLDNLHELPQPKNEFRADPFLFRKDGKQWVFFESWKSGADHARICAGRMGKGAIEDVTELDFGDVHLSYPYVFEADGEIFLIPETHERNRIEIWRCTNFPAEWELHATALEGACPADTTLIEWSGHWWLFTNLSSGSILDHCMELHVFRVDGPKLQKVEPHPLNPVVLDTTSARNGGRPFVRNGRLIRPAQITSHGLYGYGLKFMEIAELSMEDFAETEVRRIEPDRTKATTGCHHLDSCGDLFIMDVRRAYGSKLLGARPIALRAS